MAWIYLLIASAIEIGWAVGLKFTEGFSRPLPSLLVAIGIVLSFALVARSAKEIPIGTAYGVFVGLGAGGTGLLGVFMFGEPASAGRMFSLFAIIAGVAGLKFFGDARAKPTGTTKSSTGEAI